MGFSKKKCTYVRLEYDDKSSQELHGEDAQKWLDMLNEALIMDQLHGGGENHPKLNWIDTPKE